MSSGEERPMKSDVLLTLRTAGFYAVSDDDTQTIEELITYALPVRFREESRMIVVETVVAAATVFNIPLVEACNAVRTGVTNHSLTAEEAFPVVVNAGPLYSALGISFSQMLDDTGEIADTGVDNPNLWQMVRELATDKCKEMVTP